MKDKIIELSLAGHGSKKIVKLTGVPRTSVQRILKRAGVDVSMRDAKLCRRPVVGCLKCGAETTNPKFCSKSCTTSYNNTRRPKKIKQLTKRVLYGDNWQIGHITLGELKKDRKGWHRAIRDNARKMHKKFKILGICQKCGYDKMYDVCHKKPVNEFPDSATLNEINAKDNLFTFCKNHHWEFDHGVLEF
jgi:hypothetical protein